jgi:hypothetical protein
MGQERMMHKSTLAVCGLATLLAVAACESQRIASPHDSGQGLEQPGLPIGLATTACSYTPSGDISIAVGSTQTFSPSNLTDCIGAYGVITTTSHHLGFNVDTTCAVSERQEGGPAHLFKIHRCSSGGGTFRIYTNSSKTTLLQTISIDLF